MEVVQKRASLSFRGAKRRGICFFSLLLAKSRSLAALGMTSSGNFQQAMKVLGNVDMFF
jgi:hypothetical protein